MRPGHCAPEKAGSVSSSALTSSGFNEAGALCPGKRIRLLPVAQFTK